MMFVLSCFASDTFNYYSKFFFLWVHVPTCFQATEELFFGVKFDWDDILVLFCCFTELILSSDLSIFFLEQAGQSLLFLSTSILKLAVVNYLLG